MVTPSARLHPFSDKTLDSVPQYVHQSLKFRLVVIDLVLLTELLQSQNCVPPILSKINGSQSSSKGVESMLCGSAFCILTEETPLIEAVCMQLCQTGFSSIVDSMYTNARSCVL